MFKLPTSGEASDLTPYQRYPEGSAPGVVANMNRQERRAAAAARAKLEPIVRSDKGKPFAPRTLSREKFQEATAIFPIFTVGNEGQPVVVGTGFYVTRFGHFLTARHVLLEIHESPHPEGFMFHLPDDGESAIVRRITRFSYDKQADVALGALEHPGSYIFNSVPVLTTNTPDLGEGVVTVAYEKETKFAANEISIAPKYLSGELEEIHPKARDGVMLPFPCYRTSVCVPGGASGGPVFDSRGRVFAVNCSGYDGTDISFMSRITECLGLIAHGMKFGPAEQPVDGTLAQLIESGHVVCRG
jgi:Trypsin-like peptidase domain